MATERSDINAKLDAIERRLERIEGKDDMGVEALLKRFLPAETRAHLKAARKEQLLAARAFIDGWIEHEETEEPPRRRERITVE